jgi:asparaginyl-tRNA synthetase
MPNNVGFQNVVEKEFVHITYTSAVALLQKAKKTFEFPVEWGCDLQSEHERYLTEEAFCGNPVIVTDYPKEIKAFYMRENADGKTVAAMDLLVPRVGELIGGSQREERLDVLERRIEELGLNKESYWWYLDLRRYGSGKYLSSPCKDYICSVDEINMMKRLLIKEK